MRNLALLCLLSLSAVACSKSGGSSCNPNAEMVLNTETKLNVENLKSENVIVIPGNVDSKEFREEMEFVFSDGSVYKLVDDSDEDSKGYSTTINFNTMRFENDEINVPFVRNHEKGEGWYALDEESFKNEILKQPDDDDGDMRTCGINKLTMNFKVDGNTLHTEGESILKVQILNQEIYEDFKASATRP